MITPYYDEGLNKIYNLLFCDDIALFKTNVVSSKYPWNVLLSENVDDAKLKMLINDNSIESMQRLLAYNLLVSKGIEAPVELLGVIIEVGMADGLDVLAVYEDGTARYINHSGKMIIWDAPTKDSNELIDHLFDVSETVVNQIGPWKDARRPQPAREMVRLSFLVSGQLYFGEGPFDVLQSDAMGGPVINAATTLMAFLINQSERKV